jgi:hypothetical protein
MMFSSLPVRAANLALAFSPAVVSESVRWHTSGEQFPTARAGFRTPLRRDFRFQRFDSRSAEPRDGHDLTAVKAALTEAKWRRASSIEYRKEDNVRTNRRRSSACS